MTASDGLAPFLGPRARLSLAWTHPLLISIAFAASSLLLALVLIDTGADAAKREYGSACTGAQQAANVAASVPHFAAAGVNALTASSTEAFVHGLGDVLVLSLTVTEAIVNFVIDTYQALYLCIADVAVQGSLTLAIDASEAFGNLTTAAFQSVSSEVASSVKSINSAIASVVSTVDKIPGSVRPLTVETDRRSVNIQAPQFDTPSLTALANVTFPTASLTGSLQALNSSLPTLDELRGTLQAFVARPFESVETSINGTLGNFTVDQSLLPVPQRATVDLCSSIDTSFIDDVAADIRKGLIISLILLLVFALVLVGTLLLLERRSYRSRVRFVEDYRGEWAAGAVPSTVALFAFIDASHRPWLHRLVRRLVKNPARRARVTWSTLYVTQSTAIAILILGLLTLLLVELQFAFLGVIRSRGISSVGAALTDASSAIVGALGGSLNSTSADFAAQSNAHIQSLADGINQDLFAHVNTTVVTLNATLNQFYDGLVQVVNSTFGNTPLAAASLGLINCLIGRKIAGISNGLTFISECVNSLSWPS